jgi:hypothetical protein
MGTASRKSRRAAAGTKCVVLTKEHVKTIPNSKKYVICVVCKRLPIRLASFDAFELFQVFNVWF